MRARYEVVLPEHLSEVDLAALPSMDGRPLAGIAPE